jgi:hypothetical protein
MRIRIQNTSQHCCGRQNMYLFAVLIKFLLLIILELFFYVLRIFRWYGTGTGLNTGTVYLGLVGLKLG